MIRRSSLIGKGKRRVYNCKYALSSVARCGHCGDIFRRVKWNNHGRRSIVWRCVSRVEKGGPGCPARTVKESVLHAAVDRLLQQKQQALLKAGVDQEKVEWIGKRS